MDTKTMKCHYCEDMKREIQRIHNCQVDKFVAGTGTRKFKVQEVVPDARMDVDTTDVKDSMKLVENQADIFNWNPNDCRPELSNVTLVGVINADTA